MQRIININNLLQLLTRGHSFHWRSYVFWRLGLTKTMTTPERNRNFKKSYLLDFILFYFPRRFKHFWAQRMKFVFFIYIIHLASNLTAPWTLLPVHQHHSFPIQLIFNGRNHVQQVFAHLYCIDYSHLIMVFALILSHVSFYIPMYLSEQK